jgi:hypothetical protein
MKVLLVFIALSAMLVGGALAVYVIEGNSGVGYGSPMLLVNVSADRPVYHSADLMNVTFVFYSKESRNNVSLTLSGLNGKMNERRFFNVSEGLNTVYVAYRLPRCNVCGGIRAGVYNITCGMEYESFNMSQSVLVDIQQ